MNNSTILWVDQKVLREITQRQHDARESYRALKERQLNSGLINENEKIPEFDPDNLESIYFPLQEVNSEALPESWAEAQAEAPPEAQSGYFESHRAEPSPLPSGW